MPTVAGTPAHPPLVVTTGLAPQPSREAQAQKIALELNALFAPRNKRSIDRLLGETGADRLLIVENEHLCLRDREDEYRYHPNMLLVRGLNMLRGTRDLYVEAAHLARGDSVLDCTAGFACEAALAALVVGDTGNVVALESVPELALVTRQGLQEFTLAQKPLREAMRRVVVCAADYRDYLPRAANRSFDVVAFDPFFDDRLPGSEHTVSPLARFGNRALLDIPSVIEAQRVARRRVLIKHPKSYDLPEEIRSARTDIVTTRRGGVAYSVLPAF